MDHGSWITRGAQRSPIATRFEFTPFLFLGLSYVYFFPVVSSWVAPECHHMWVVGCPESCTNDDRRGDAHSLVNRRVEEHMDGTCRMQPDRVPYTVRSTTTNAIGALLLPCTPKGGWRDLRVTTILLCTYTKYHYSVCVLCEGSLGKLQIRREYLSLIMRRAWIDRVSSRAC